jgi:GWxTD domain-containing protein
VRKKYRKEKMKQIHFVFILVLVCLIVIPGSAKKEDFSKNWVKGVELIITDAEKTEFETLKKDKDREAFIQLFWAKRDPTPQTEHNEFKEEFYRRLAYVAENFIYGYNKGVQTDQGKVYIRLGDPLKIFHQGANTEVWAYSTPSWIEYPKPSFNLVFADDGNGLVLDRTRTEARLIQALYSYPEVVLLYPDLKTVPEYKHILAFSPDSFEGKLIQQVESSGEDVIQVPFEQRVFFTKAGNLSSYLTFLFKIDPQTKIPDKLTIFGRLKSEGYSADIRREIKLFEENDYLFAQVGMPVLPGEYELFIGLYTKDQQLYSLKKEKIIVPNYWTKALEISSLIASPEVNARESFREEEFNIFSVGSYSLSPRYSQKYTKGQALNIFYYIYNFVVDAKNICSLLIEFEIHYGEQVFKLNPQKIQKKAEGGILLEGTQIPLAALPEPGEYAFVIRITDEINKATASQRMTFTMI